MNYLIGFVIFAGGLSILVDPAPPINIFGLPKGDVIPYGLSIPVGSVMALLGLLFIYRELKKVVEGLQIWLLKVMKNE